MGRTEAAGEETRGYLASLTLFGLAAHAVGTIRHLSHGELRLDGAAYLVTANCGLDLFWPRTPNRRFCAHRAVVASIWVVSGC